MQNINFYYGSMCQETIRLVQVIYFCDQIINLVYMQHQLICKRTLRKKIFEHKRVTLYHFFSTQVGASRHIQIKWVDSQDNTAEIFTNVLQGDTFTSLQKFLMGW